jgi:hypothetical protein
MLRPELLFIMLRPELLFIMLRPELLFIMLRPELLFIMLRSELLFIMLRPELLFIMLRPELLFIMRLLFVTDYRSVILVSILIIVSWSCSWNVYFQYDPIEPLYRYVAVWIPTSRHICKGK